MGFDFGQAVTLTITVVIFSLVAWAVYTIVQWYKDPSKRPRWVTSFLNIFSPVKYDKMSGYVPYANATATDITTLYTLDSSSKTANACASNCSLDYSCNGIVFAHGNCYQVKDDFGTLIMNPDTSADTYIKGSSGHPKYGFVPSVKDYAFDPTLLSQHLGSPINQVLSNVLSINCMSQSASNCSGFSTDSFMKQTWFVKDLSNTAATANVSSYILTSLSSANWKDSGF